MLLFEYGTFDWGKGNFFEFGISRFIFKRNEDELYQLSMTLYFEPIDIKRYDGCWNHDFDNLEKWKENIEETEGYKLFKCIASKKFEIRFFQV
jgi:hypothetical protein